MVPKWNSNHLLFSLKGIFITFLFSITTSCLKFKKDLEEASIDQNTPATIKGPTVYNFLRMENINIYDFVKKYPSLETLEVKNSSKRSGFKILASEIRQGMTLPINRRSKNDYLMAKITLEDGTLIHVQL